jgi:hypothetical protein
MIRCIAVGALTALTTAGACVAPSVSVSGTPQQPLRTSPRIVTIGDLDRFADLPLDAALLRVRPELLRFRNQAPLVYVDGRPASGAELRDFTAGAVASVRLLTPVEAALEYGSLYGTGPVLDVRLRRVR